MCSTGNQPHGGSRVWSSQGCSGAFQVHHICLCRTHDAAGLIMWSLTSPFTVLIGRINDLLPHIDFIFSSCILGYIFLELPAFFLLHVHLDTQKRKKRYAMNWWSETSLWRVRKDFGFETGALQWVWPAYKMQWGRGEEGGTSWSVQRERERERERKREWVSCSVFSQQKSLSPVWLLHQRHRPDMSRIARCR